jgi:hypothetical protein
MLLLLHTALAPTWWAASCTQLNLAAVVCGSCKHNSSAQQQIPVDHVSMRNERKQVPHTPVLRICEVASWQQLGRQLR